MIDKNRFAAFISSRRREKGLTQRQLAERLHVSDKAVSKWERALSLPDIALLEPLADALGVTVTELLRGEALPPETRLDLSEVDAWWRIPSSCPGAARNRTAPLTESTCCAGWS